MKEDIFWDRMERPVTRPNNKAAKSRSSVYGAVVEGGKILLVKSRYSPRWDIPGGGLERGEDETAALKREMLEEAKCEVLEIGEMIGESFGKLYADDVDEYYNNSAKYYLITKYRLIDGKIDDVEIEKSVMFDLKTFDFTHIRSDQTDIIRNLIKNLK